MNDKREGLVKYLALLHLQFLMPFIFSLSHSLVPFILTFSGLLEPNILVKITLYLG